MNRHVFPGKLRKLKALSASLALFGLLAASAPAAWAQQQETAQQVKEIRNLLTEKHINGSAVKNAQSDTIDGLIGALGDPYTEYFDEEKWNLFQNSIEMNYAGIGMRLGQDEGGFIAVDVFEKSPAEAAGLKRGDYVTAVAGQTTAGLTIYRVTALVRGPEGTEVELKVKRGGEEIALNVKRGTIQLPSVSGAVLAGGVGYLNVDSFSEEADELFAAMLDEVKKHGVKGLVVDLRDNPGGLLETAKHIAEQFIPEGVLIHTRDKNGVDEPVPIENGKSVTFPVIVLVNENSASASELLTAALQDYSKALALGKTTYGKGSVQALYPLESGGVLKVTVQEYLSPNKRVVNKVGVRPDIEIEGTVPQLLTGLREAGLDEIRLEADKHSYLLNGYEFFDAALPSVTADDGVYLPARVLAASIGEPLVWNESLQGVEIGKSGDKHIFDAAAGFRNVNGTGFIELHKFREQYPQIDWTSDSEKTVLTVKGTGM